MTYDYRSASKPIALDKRAIREFITEELMPMILHQLRKFSPQDPLGSGKVLARQRFQLEDVRSETLEAEVTVVTKATGTKGTSVLSGSATPAKFYDGVYLSKVELEVNGALSPTDFLVPSKMLNRLEPLGSCTSLACLPYGLYNLLIHELTHVADRYMGKVDYYKSDMTVDDAKYYNHPGEVRAFMQTIVEETVTMGRRLHEHMQGNNKRLIEMCLKTSDTWKVVGEKVNAQNRNKIMKAVYTAFEQEGLIS